MARPKTVHSCSACGHSTARWHGQCPECGEWNTIVEDRVQGAARTERRAGALSPVALREVAAVADERIASGIGELDRVLGGGFVPGSVVLLGGAPGIGKSTLASMVLANVVGAGGKVLYVSAEESAEQIRLRAARLGEGALDVPVLAETDLSAVIATVEAERPALCVVDSVQALHSDALTSAPGTVSQVREAAVALMEVAKRQSVAIVLVGHITKDGDLAGPRVLEHLVDCVLRFDGERERTYRTVRALKNRFGSTAEAGVFEMSDGGLVEVLDASARFVAEATRAPGSVVLCAMEGSRPLLVEVQALVSPSELSQPRRIANGLDRNRLALVLAVLARHAGFALGCADVFINVVGGVRIDEPGADMAIALAVAAAAGGKVPGDGHLPVACFGELGLTGEVRSVAHADRRLAEARRFGLGPVIAPEGSGEGSAGAAQVRAALEIALGSSAGRGADHLSVA